MADRGLMYGLKLMTCPLLLSLLVLLLAPPAARLAMPSLPIADNRKHLAVVARSVLAYAFILSIHFVGMFAIVPRSRGLAALAWWSVNAAFLVTHSTLARNGTDYGELLAAGIVSGFMLIITLFPSLAEKMVGVDVVAVPSSE